MPSSPGDIQSSPGDRESAGWTDRRDRSSQRGFNGGFCQWPAGSSSGIGCIVALECGAAVERVERRHLSAVVGLGL